MRVSTSSNTRRCEIKNKKNADFSFKCGVEHVDAPWAQVQATSSSGSDGSFKVDVTIALDNGEVFAIAAGQGHACRPTRTVRLLLLRPQLERGESRVLALTLNDTKKPRRVVF